MRYAIVESGGKQYRVVEGRTIEVDRLPIEAGKKFDFERVLFMTDGDEIMVGTPTVSGIEVKVTVADHIKGPKIDRFKYRPKKRIRVRGGHRQHYTLLMVNFIGKPGEVRQVEKPALSEVEGQQEIEVEAETDAVEVMEAKPRAEKKAKAEKPAKVEKDAAKPSTRKTTATKSSSKKTDSKKK